MQSQQSILERQCCWFATGNRTGIRVSFEPSFTIAPYRTPRYVILKVRLNVSSDEVGRTMHAGRV